MSRRLSEQDLDSASPPAPPAPLAGKSFWWLWVSSGLLVVLGLGSMFLLGQGGWRAQGATELQHFGTVPGFTLVERSGQTVNATDLHGKVWVANFIYTRCVTECPLLSNAIAQLQSLLAGNTEVRLVSITVDPEHDTPEVLTRYAQSFVAHPQHWLFLTGDKAAIYRLALEGFHLGVGDPQNLRKSSTIADIQHFAWKLGRWLGPGVALAHHSAHPAGQDSTVLHSRRFVLVDRQGQIRKYYDGMEPESVRHIYHDIRRVLRER